MFQENLLPDTRAIPKGTIEWTIWKGKHLVRYKDLRGIVRRQDFPLDEPGELAAIEYLDRCKTHLHRTAKAKEEKRCEKMNDYLECQGLPRTL